MLKLAVVHLVCLVHLSVSDSSLGREERSLESLGIAGGIGLISDLLAISQFVVNQLTGGDERILHTTLNRLSVQLDAVEAHLKSSMEQIRAAIEADTSKVGQQPQMPMNLIQFEGMKNRFFGSEQTIRNCYEHWRAYLTTKTERAREDFILQSSELVKSLNTLLDGLLGSTIFGSDLLVVTQLAYESHPRKFRQDANNYLELVGIGVGVLAAYYHYSQTLEANKNYWMSQLAGKELAARERIKRIEEECRQESRVSDEISRIMAEQVLSDEWGSNQQMANRVLAFLTEKYDSRSWFVLVHDLPPVEYNSIENRWGQYPWAANDPSLHRASVKGKNVLASSVGPEDRWTEEELLAVRQSVNRYCFSPAYTNNRRLSRLKMPAVELVPRCQHYRADAVLDQLTSALPVGGKLAVLLGGTRPANALALHQNAPFEPVYLSFGPVNKNGEVCPFQLCGNPQSVSSGEMHVLVLPAGRRI